MDAYGELCARFYDLDKPLDAAADRPIVAWYAEALPFGAPVLEPMCGSGRYLVPLCRLGFDVDGVDASPAMLDACRRRAAGLPRPPRLYAQDFARMGLPTQYAAAYVPAGSFGLLADGHAARDALRRLAACLLPGAVVLLSFEVPRVLPAGGIEDHRTVVDGDERIELRVRTTPGDAPGVERHACRYRLWRADRVVREEAEVIQVLAYTPEGMLALLAEMGFVDVCVLEPPFGPVARGRLPPNPEATGRVRFPT